MVDPVGGGRFLVSEVPLWRDPNVWSFALRGEGVTDLRHHAQVYPLDLKQMSIQAPFLPTKFTAHMLDYY